MDGFPTGIISGFRQDKPYMTVQGRARKVSDKIYPNELSSWKHPGLRRGKETIAFSRVGSMAKKERPNPTQPEMLITDPGTMVGIRGLSMAILHKR